MAEVLEIRGLDAVNKLLKSLPAMVQDERLLDDIVAIMINRTRNRFLREVAPDEMPWPPSKGGEIRKAGGYTYGGDGFMYSGGGTLFMTGKLFHSIQPFRPGKMKRGIGTDIPYARYHQLGLGQKVREFLGISETDRQVIDLLINRRLTDWLAEQRLV